MSLLVCNTCYYLRGKPPLLLSGGSRSLSNKDIAKNYSDFKRELLANNITDRKEYKRLKADYVFELIKQANLFYYK